MSAPQPHLNELANYERVIRPKKGLVAVDFDELWRYRELFWFLAWRDILVRYKQAVLGIAWAVLKPFLTMVVFTLVFGKLADMAVKLKMSVETFAVFTLAGLLPWQFFSNAMAESSNSLVGSSNMISKIYFPRLIIPAGAVVTSFVDFLITLGLMAALMVWYQFLPDWRLFLLPAFVILAFACAFGAGLWLAALNVKYRDFRYIVPFIVQFGLYVSPVGFSSTIVPERWQFLYSLNPMVGVIDGFRWSLLRGAVPLPTSSLLASVALTSVLCLSGIYYFRKTEKSFADVI